MIPWIKRGIQSLLGRFGLILERKVETLRSPPSILSFVVSERLRSERPFFFIQIGANDGIVGDPLRPLILKYGLRGILVEPQPESYRRLIDNYPESPQLAFDNCAVGYNDGKAEMYRVKSGSPLPESSSCYTSFNKSAVLAQPKVKPEYVEKVQVTVKTLPSLLSQFQVDHVSLLQVDAEGFDFEIVKLALDAGIRPDIMNFEYVLLSPNDRIECCRRLKTSGYDFLEVGMDMLAVRQGWTHEELGFAVHS